MYSNTAMNMARKTEYFSFRFSETDKTSLQDGNNKKLNCSPNI